MHLETLIQGREKLSSSIDNTVTKLNLIMQPPNKSQLISKCGRHQKQSDWIRLQTRLRLRLKDSMPFVRIEAHPDRTAPDMWEFHLVAIISQTVVSLSTWIILWIELAIEFRLQAHLAEPNFRVNLCLQMVAQPLLIIIWPGQVATSSSTSNRLMEPRGSHQLRNSFISKRELQMRKHISQWWQISVSQLFRRWLWTMVFRSSVVIQLVHLSNTI